MSHSWRVAARGDSDPPPTHRSPRSQSRRARSLVPSPHRPTEIVVEDVAMLAVNRRKDRTGPPFRANDWRRQVVASEPAGVRAFERVDLHLSSDGATEEQERIQRNP